MLLSCRLASAEARRQGQEMSSLTSLSGTVVTTADVTACAEAAALVGRPVPRSRRAWPATRRSASRAAAADNDHWSSGGHAPRPAARRLTGQRGEVDKWTEGQRLSRRSGNANTTLVTTPLRSAFCSIRTLTELDPTHADRCAQNERCRRYRVDTGSSSKWRS